jgi:hypothetical protein
MVQELEQDVLDAAAARGRHGERLLVPGPDGTNVPVQL